MPSHVFGDVLKRVKPLLRPDARIIWATKGLEAETGRLLGEVVREVLGDKIPLAMISGPSLPKSWLPGCRRRLLSRRQNLPLRMRFSSFSTAAKASAFIKPGFYRDPARRCRENVIAIGAGSLTEWGSEPMREQHLSPVVWQK